jgi:hypothetical protein
VVEALRPLGFGEVLDSGFAIYRKGFLNFVAISACAQVPSTLLSLVLAIAMAQGARSTLASALAFAAVTVVSILLFVAEWGALAAYAGSFFGLGPTGVRSAYRLALDRLGGLLICIVLYVVAMAVGFGLFLVPGVVVGVRFSLGIQAILFEEHTVWQAFRRSYELTRGGFWRLLGVFVIAVVVVVVLSSLIQLPFGVMRVSGGPRDLGAGILFPSLGSLVSHVLLTSLVVVMQTVLYVDRRLQMDSA